MDGFNFLIDLKKKLSLFFLKFRPDFIKSYFRKRLFLYATKSSLKNGKKRMSDIKSERQIEKMKSKLFDLDIEAGNDGALYGNSNSVEKSIDDKHHQVNESEIKKSLKSKFLNSDQSIKWIEKVERSALYSIERNHPDLTEHFDELLPDHAEMTRDLIVEKFGDDVSIEAVWIGSTVMIASTIFAVIQHDKQKEKEALKIEMKQKVKNDEV